MGLLILIAALLAIDAPQFRVDLVDGGSAVGALVQLNGQEVVVRVADADRTFKLSDVRFIDAVKNPTATNTATKEPASAKEPSTSSGQTSKSAATPPVVLETLDGGRLPGLDYEVTKGVSRLKLLSGDTLAVPTKYIHRVEFNPGGKAAVWPEMPKDAAGDLIVVQKKEAIDLVEGVVGDITAETVQFSIDADVVPVKRARVVGVVYFHSPQANFAEDAAAIVENTAGWKLRAKQVALVDGKLAITTTFGADLTWPLDSVRSIDFSPSRLVYLSDLPLDSADWTPLLDFGKQTEAIAQFYKPRFDRGLDGGPLSISGTPFRKGVAMAAHTVLEYKIAGRGKQFQATAGIDDSVHGAGNVKLTIEGDGKTLYSGKITGHDKPVDLNFDVSNVKRLRIMADFGGGPDVGDYLDLGDARIVK